MMSETSWLCMFGFLLIFRYLRLFVHLISFYLYKPTPVSRQPEYNPSDCAVIVPTVDPGNHEFVECLNSILAACPGSLFVVTVGHGNLVKCIEVCDQLRSRFPKTSIKVTSTRLANKRGQVAHALALVQEHLTVLVDDHVIWPSTEFLRHAIAPFEDARVGVVGTKKRVRRQHGNTLSTSFWNLIGCLYLERHNWEIVSSTNIDGGIFAVSGRTSIHRSCILQDPKFLERFTNERFFFGLFGPLNADDDNFMTRWEIAHGWKIRIQYSEPTTIETTLGEYPRFLSQALRWARTTYRSNTATLLTERSVWYAHPQLWSIYAVYITGLVNLAFFYDSAMILSLTKSGHGGALNISLMVFLIFATKLVKPFAHFVRHPRDLFLFPFCILFAYFHSFLKLYAACTFYETNWGGRNLESVTNDNEDELPKGSETVDSSTPGPLFSANMLGDAGRSLSESEPFRNCIGDKLDKLD